MTAEETAAITRRMQYRIEDAFRFVDDIERIARRHKIKITVNFGAELAHTRDAITELAEQIHKL